MTTAYLNNRPARLYSADSFLEEEGASLKTRVRSDSQEPPSPRGVQFADSGSSNPPFYSVPRKVSNDLTRLHSKVDDLIGRAKVLTQVHTTPILSNPPARSSYTSHISNTGFDRESRKSSYRTEVTNQNKRDYSGDSPINAKSFRFGDESYGLYSPIQPRDNYYSSGNYNNPLKETATPITNHAERPLAYSTKVDYTSYISPYQSPNTDKLDNMGTSIAKKTSYDPVYSYSTAPSRAYETNAVKDYYKETPVQSYPYNASATNIYNLGASTYGLANTQTYESTYTHQASGAKEQNSPSERPSYRLAAVAAEKSDSSYCCGDFENDTDSIMGGIAEDGARDIEKNTQNYTNFYTGSLVDDFEDDEKPRNKKIGQKEELISPKKRSSLNDKTTEFAFKSPHDQKIRERITPDQARKLFDKNVRKLEDFDFAKNKIQNAGIFGQYGY